MTHRPPRTPHALRQRGRGRRREALERVRAAVFDMDGLLLDSERLAARALAKAASQLGVALDEGLVLAMIGRNAEDSRRMLHEGTPRGFPVDALFDACRRVYDETAIRDGVPVKAGVHAMLEWLARLRWPCAVATSTGRDRALAQLARAGLAPHFHSVVGGDEVSRGKPAPDIYVEAARRLDLAADECVAFEDSEPGARAALAAGMQVFLVPDLAPLPASLHELPIRIVANLELAREQLDAAHGYNPPP